MKKDRKKKTTGNKKKPAESKRKGEKKIDPQQEKHCKLHSDFLREEKGWYSGMMERGFCTKKLHLFTERRGKSKSNWCWYLQEKEKL